MLAVITARGGSKRIPGKNIKDFLGKPILCYSIEAALQSGLFAEVMVSTDDPKIAEIAKAAGATVPFLRSEATSDDYATTADVLKEVLESYAARGQTFSYMACLYPTAPFVTAQKLQKAFQVLKDSDAAMVMPVVAYSFPPQRSQVIRSGKLQYLHPEHQRTRSQDLEKIYHDCGQFYFHDVQALLHPEHSQKTGCVPMIVPETEVQDIDELSDWEMAEIKYERMMRLLAKDEMQ